MLGTLRVLWRRHRLACAGFILALLVTLFFTARFLVFTLYWSDPAHREQPPQAWMTPRYIAHSWDLDPVEVSRALGVTPQIGKRPTLNDIARARGVPLEIVLAEVRALIERRTETQ